MCKSLKNDYFDELVAIGATVVIKINPLEGCLQFEDALSSGHDQCLGV
jgi:hypothetical protein